MPDPSWDLYQQTESSFCRAGAGLGGFTGNGGFQTGNTYSGGKLQTLLFFF